MVSVQGKQRSSNSDRIDSGKIPSLSGVRAISFLIVFVAHAGLDRIVPGRLGVAIFFFLSGYLITALMIREREKTGFISLKLFYLRRTLRIWPPMYAILFGTLIVLAAAHQTHGLTIQGVCSQLFFYQNYYFHSGQGLIPGLGVLWSLAVEEHFYLLFPLLMLYLLVRQNLSYRQVSITLSCLCAIFFAWRCFVATHFSNGLEWARDTTDCRADSILFGCVLACAERTKLCREIFSLKKLERVILPIAIATLLASLLIRNPLFRETFRYSMQSIAIAPILYYVIYWPKRWVGRILNSRVLVTLGTLSYAMYLIHYTVLLEFGRVIKSEILVGIASLLVTIIIAQCVFLWIEKPMDRIRKSLHAIVSPVSPAEVVPRAT